MNWLQLARTPQAYHGGERAVTGRGPYFEGWYVKLASADLQARLALIPGVFVGSHGESEAFVQVLDGITGASSYHRFDADQFRASDRQFDVWVGTNHFDDSGVSVDLPAADGIPALRGRIDYVTAPQGWPVSWRAPGAMGWYGWLPFLECYHGVVGFGHELAGALSGTSFDGGRGYIEKDWGQAFPSAYIWFASNHFPDPELSLMGSIAIIPWRRSAFRGFLVGLRTATGLHSFTTYGGARTEHLSVSTDHVDWTLVGAGGERLELRCTRARGGLLAAPVRTEMHHRIEETLDATVSVRLWSAKHELLVSQEGQAAGLEVHGDLDRLLAMN